VHEARAIKLLLFCDVRYGYLRLVTGALKPPHWLVTVPFGMMIEMMRGTLSPGPLGSQSAAGRS
jgi:hypothetical protein